MAGAGTILLVDDNPDDVEFTRRAFSRNDFRNPIVVARDGAEALEMLLPGPDAEGLRPAVILLDVNLPKVSGLDVLARLRADPGTAVVPVIMLSTSGEARDIVGSYRRGANGYVRKPVRFEDFVAATKALGVYWLQVNEPVPHGA